jgi:rhodanese-related sulfurtransferase
MALKTITDMVNEHKASLRFLDPDTAMPALATETNRLIIDVREPREYATKKVSSGILNIPRGLLETNIFEHTKDPDTIIYLDGAAGDRAILAAATLQSMGFTNVNVLDFDCDDVVADMSHL